MINSRSLLAVESATFTERWRRPDWGGYCFAGIPDALVRLLTGQGDPGLPVDVFGSFAGQHERVLLVFLDGFGWSTFEQHQQQSFLSRFVEHGVVSKLTSMFPSTTSAQMTCLHTGLPPGLSGIYEWLIYEPSVDLLIAPLRFAFAGDGKPDTLKARVDPAALYPWPTTYQRLARAGVSSVVFQPADITNSPFSKEMLKGAERRGYATIGQAVKEIGEVFRQRDGAQFVLLYISAVDSVAHQSGPATPRHDAIVSTVLDDLAALNRQDLGETLLLFTADHGHTTIDPGTTIFVNESLRSLSPLLRRGRNGQPLAPAGSPRDFFIHVADGALDAAESLLVTAFAGRADVFRTAALAAAGLFGPIGPAFESRVGELVVLPYAGESVWWRDPGRFDQRYRGHHGGLSAEEIEIPFLVVNT